MKATVRKIKDNEWIAEVSDYTFEYPIIGDTSNFKEGQEIDGTIKDFYDRDERTVFELQSHRKNLEKGWAEHNAKTNPPIHSDPAGEPNEKDIDEAYWGWFMKEERINGGISGLLTWEQAIQWVINRNK